MPKRKNSPNLVTLAAGRLSGNSHQSVAWFCDESLGGSGDTSRLTWVQTLLYRSRYEVVSVQGTISGRPNNVGRYFSVDKK